MDSNLISLKLKTLTTKPGVYRFYDEKGELLYVGKAKNLRNRISSYFTKNHVSPRICMMVSRIKDFQITVVDSEWEALLLENNMIKEFNPRFNVMLKDDKTYPWLAITKDTYPTLFLTRKPDYQHCEIFGPYSSVYSVQLLLDTLLTAFQIRTCKNIKLSRRPCLQYQIKKCAAPCVGYISKELYQSQIQQIREIIKGNASSVVKQFKEEMMKHADTWEFEKAQILKEKILILEKFHTKSTVVNPNLGALDIFSFDEDENSAYINFMRMKEGSVIQSYTFEINLKSDYQQEELLSMGMGEVVNRFGTLSQEIIVPFLPEIQAKNQHFTTPKTGDKKKLLDLSLKNVHTYMQEKKKRLDLVKPERHSQRILMELQKVLDMNVLPTHIECFDNSNTQGMEPVAAMVCFLNAKPAKKEYRHFNIQTVEGPDDFASMYEVVKRRYSRLKAENKPLPQLVLIDGGKGQLGMAYKALCDIDLQNKLMLIGIAKRLEDIYKVGDPLPLYIDKKSEAQKLLQYIRDEVHRFGIMHHRKRRSKKSITSELDNIQGIGATTIQKLLSHFKSVKRIKDADFDEIKKLIGQTKAQIIAEHFK
jgi:excinuclease ABC subunit C